MVKNYLFYQLIVIVHEGKDDRGVSAERVLKNLAFPKHEDSLNTLSEYAEAHSEFTPPMSVFDNLHDDYAEWLKF